ncbi:DUF3592 domain-containing protein [Micromonospora sp. NPDC005189]|uniref:DUF3592 domain-containing protein n=1 Tax=unclassified Micromonospora TaxID=2617518 RepID=UPI0033A44F35
MNSGAIITIVVGVSLACVGLFQAWGFRKLRRTGVASVGTVVGHERTVDDGALYAPVIAFVDENGRKRQFTVPTRTSGRVHRVGQEVPVVYPPGRPHDPRLSSFTHYVLQVGLPLAVGALFALLGLLGLRQV